MGRVTLSQLHGPVQNKESLQQESHPVPPREQPLPQPAMAHRGPWSLLQVIDGSRS